VSTQRTQATEEINTDLELNSAVEINFRTDFIPLNRMAAQAQADRIRNASLNPVAEADPSVERRLRQGSRRQAEQQRREGLLTMPAMPSASSRETPAATSKQPAAPEARQTQPQGQGQQPAGLQQQPAQKQQPT